MRSASDAICAVGSCERPVYCRCWCKRHYSRWQRTGDPVGGRRAPDEPRPECSISGCTSTARTRGWCVMHYNRWLNHGDPETASGRWSRRPSAEELREVVRRDAERTRDEDADGPPGACGSCGERTPCGCCRLWAHSRTAAGYGKAAYGPSRDGKLTEVYVHRWAWEQVNGPIPDGMFVMHVCDQPACFYVGHLRLGSHTDNMRDMLAKGRSGARRADDNGSCIHGHVGKFVRGRTGKRICTECRDISARAYQERRRSSA